MRSVHTLELLPLFLNVTGKNDFNILKKKKNKNSATGSYACTTGGFAVWSHHPGGDRPTGTRSVLCVWRPQKADVSEESLPICSDGDMRDQMSWQGMSEGATTMQRGAAASTLDGPAAVTDVKKGKKKKKGISSGPAGKKHEESV